MCKGGPSSPYAFHCKASPRSSFMQRETRTKPTATSSSSSFLIGSSSSLMTTTALLTGPIPDLHSLTTTTTNSNNPSWPDDLYDLLRSLSSSSSNATNTTTTFSSPKSSSMASWIQKRHFVEQLVGTLQRHPSPLPCNLLLRVLRLASMVGANAALLGPLEARASAQLDQASLEELLIPAFSHTCGTLLDVGLALRLARGFAVLGEAARASGGATARVARLLDGYLAEAAVDANMRVVEFEALATALPPHTRASDDGLYRAVDTFLKAHPGTAKQERKALFRLVDTRKLSSEASLHVAQNERLPVRAAIQVLFSEHTKLNGRLHHYEWGSGSFSGPRSPHVDNLSGGARCPSKREAASAQQQEVRKLREDVARLQVQCQWLQSQLERVAGPAIGRGKKKKKKGRSVWKALWFRGGEGSKDGQEEEEEEEEDGLASATTTVDTRRSRLGKSTPPPAWRNSMS